MSGTLLAPVRPVLQAPTLYKGFDCVAAQQFPHSGTFPKAPDYYRPILAEDNIPFATLPTKLVELVKHCWQFANANTNADRSRIQIGTSNARTNHIPNRINQLASGGKMADMIAANRLKELHSTPHTKPIGPMGGDIATDFKLTDSIQRVAAYTFRGDRRSPKELEAAGGFHPPITRNDQYYVDNVVFPYFRRYMQRRFNIDINKQQFDVAYHQQFVSEKDKMLARTYVMWRTLVENESHHIGRMVAKEDLKGYVSTSRSIMKAKFFATGGYVYANCDGWVYVTLVRGGFDLSQTTAFQSKEQEIAFPGTLSWNDIFGFRQCLGRAPGLSGPIYLRAGFRSRNPTAYQRVLELLSGKDERL